MINSKKMIPAIAGSLAVSSLAINGIDQKVSDIEEEYIERFNQ